ncbi:protein SULFUR DEFICIENCY-INDUCED 1 isoform X2 [Tripterygium wilfordii]|uniref:protein SULFUR DEFICIENCY-INDUCED 1 isoform X2 n=1 Tax=Tripterygium wilfordii TaxID=458696 RepID=UPI0018F7EB98|nr:protein SULFUR DEFICIENCY-INDUCED 1 isoform X2 [Tripterygium wilfordii]
MNHHPRLKGERSQLLEPPPPYHVIYKLPPGDGPYVRAKHVQLVQKDPEAAIVLFWKAINAGDRVDSALKDMAIIMKQQERAEEAIEAVKSFRHLCSKQAQESLNNVLIDLYKKCGRVDEQIELLKERLRMIYQGEAFNGKPTKTARSHGKKFQVTIKQETSRILGNLGWAYMQKENYKAAEVVYRKAQQIDPDANKACNLCLCMIKQARFTEARIEIDEILQGKLSGSDEPKSRNRAEALLRELDTCQPASSLTLPGLNLEDAFIEGLDQLITQQAPYRSRRLPIFEEISSFRDQLAC